MYLTREVSLPTYSLPTFFYLCTYLRWLASCSSYCNSRAALAFEHFCLTMETEKTISVWDRGDLTLIVGSRRQKFIVSSHTMAVASKVFQNMLFGDYSESQKSSDSEGSSSSPSWAVCLPEDDPEPFQMILEMIHRRFTRTITCTTLSGTSELYKVTVLTDKYDLSHILRPHTQRWLHEIHVRLSRASFDWSLRGISEILWITWELGSQVHFETSLGVLLITIAPWNIKLLKVDQQEERSKQQNEQEKDGAHNPTQNSEAKPVFQILPPGVACVSPPSVSVAQPTRQISISTLQSRSAL